MNELAHHGIKGQRWGVRRYQNYDGSYTNAGRKRYDIQTEKVHDAAMDTLSKVTGRQYVDTHIEAGTTLSRIQTSRDFGEYAFYATHEQADNDRYLGLFGGNLKRRAEAEARAAERTANKSGKEEDALKAKELREKSDSIKVYQLGIEAKKKLSIPSDEHAADITAKLMRDKKFKEDVEYSINDARSKMLRPQQQMLFEQAQMAMNNYPNNTKNERIALYRATNLSLTFHDERQSSMQSTLYSELKKNGYDALIDINDKNYSSYHAKSPVIVFNNDAVTLKAIQEANPRIAKEMNKKYSQERARKEVFANSVGLVVASGSMTYSKCVSRNKKMRDYYLS